MTTAEEKAAYAEELKQAREEAATVEFEPTSPDITESEWQAMLDRQSQDDAKWLFTVTEESGGPNVVADPEPPPEETQPEEPPPAAETLPEEPPATEEPPAEE